MVNDYPFAPKRPDRIDDMGGEDDEFPANYEEEVRNFGPKDEEEMDNVSCLSTFTSPVRPSTAGGGCCYAVG